MLRTGLLVYLSYLSAVHSLPPDKVLPFHIIKPRSIDLNDAHSLGLEPRLSGAVVPSSYKLELEPYLEDAIFNGRVTINVSFVRDVTELDLHCSHKIRIIGMGLSARFPEDPDDLKNIPIEKITWEPKKPIATMKLEQTVPKGSLGHIRFEFNGSMETGISEAFCKRVYTENEVERIVAALHLRPTNARRVFPCFDEPGYKAAFELSVVAPRNKVVLSNTPISRIENIPGEPDAVWVHFERTPVMSTFALGLVIADLVQDGLPTIYKYHNCSIETTNSNSTWCEESIELRVWARPEFLDPIKDVKSKLQEVFGLMAPFWLQKLPLKKLDVVALPTYKGVKPGDSWGLIVFKESDLANKGYYQLAQEVGYQWLGGLTSPAWWSEAHINKALVGFLAAKISSRYGLDVESKWPITVLYSLYYEYGKRYPHSRITGMKQETASTKLELLFRMFMFTIGPEKFKKGLQNFVEEKKFKTFTGDDIWDALSKVKGADQPDVKVVAKSWIEKDRIPLITVKRNYDGQTITVSQKVYLRDRPKDSPDAGRLTWWVPLVVVPENHLIYNSKPLENTVPVHWLRDKRELLINEPTHHTVAIIVNPNEIAPFPVNYDERNWRLLAGTLTSENRNWIPELTRAKLIHDAWNLAYAGELSFAVALNMTRGLYGEKNPLVWDPVFTMIDHLGRRVCHSTRNKLEEYTIHLLKPLYEYLYALAQSDKLNGTVTPSWRKTFLSMTRSFLCQAGYKPCLINAQNQYGVWMQSKHPDEGNPVPNHYICPVFKYGTIEEWEFGLQRVINFPPSRQKSERTFLLKSLAGCPKDDEKIFRLLNVTMLEGNGNFTESDIFLIFGMLAGHCEGSQMLTRYLYNNFTPIMKKYRRKTNLWDSLFASSTASLYTEQDLQELAKLFMEYKSEFGSALHLLDKRIKVMREEARWTSANIPVFHDWLVNYLNDSSVYEGEKHLDPSCF